MNLKSTSPFLFFLSIVIISFFLYFRNAKNSNTNQSTTSKKISSDFKRAHQSAKEKYLGKTLLIKGHITNADSTSIELDSNAICYFTHKLTNLKDTSIVFVKGRCVGYDQLLKKVKIDHCVLQRKTF